MDRLVGRVFAVQVTLLTQTRKRLVAAVLRTLDDQLVLTCSCYPLVNPQNKFDFLH